MRTRTRTRTGMNACVLTGCACLISQIYGFRMSVWEEHLNTLRPSFDRPESLECVREVAALCQVSTGSAFTLCRRVVRLVISLTLSDSSRPAQTSAANSGVKPIVLQFG